MQRCTYQTQDLQIIARGGSNQHPEVVYSTFYGRPHDQSLVIAIDPHLGIKSLSNTTRTWAIKFAFHSR